MGLLNKMTINCIIIDQNLMIPMSVYYKAPFCELFNSSLLPSLGLLNRKLLSVSCIITFAESY